MGRSREREAAGTDNGMRDGTGGDAENASNQPETTEAEQRRDGETIERTPSPVFAEPSHAEEPQGFKALARKHFKND